MTGAERQARLRAKQAAGAKPVHYVRPSDRRSRPQQWTDAIDILRRCLDAYQVWRDHLPANLAETATGKRLSELLELRKLVEALEAAELPKGFGRDRTSGKGRMQPVPLDRNPLECGDHPGSTVVQAKG